MLEKERQLFADKHSELLAMYPDKFVVIKEDEIVGAFATIEEALSEAARRFGLQPFLVRKVTQELESVVDVPALTLGILNADSSRPI